jgi:hypothetical protein
LVRLWGARRLAGLVAAFAFADDVRFAGAAAGAADLLRAFAGLAAGLVALLLPVLAPEREVERLAFAMIVLRI